MVSLNKPRSQFEFNTNFPWKEVWIEIFKYLNFIFELLIGSIINK